MDTDHNKPERVLGRIRIGNEVFSGVIAGAKATENIIRTVDPPERNNRKEDPEDNTKNPLLTPEPYLQIKASSIVLIFLLRAISRSGISSAVR